MSERYKSSLPPELQERLEAESPNDRAGLERVWAMLGRVDPSGDVPDASDTWARVEAHLDDVPDASAPDPSFDASPPPNGRAASERSPSDRTASDRTASDRPPSRRRAGSRRAVGAALVAALVLAVIGGAWLWRQPVTVSAPAGTQQVATLPDGSTMELNSGSTVTYRRGFQAWPFVDAARRTVRLDGEAFFDVSRTERPFVVETFNARVEVLGTRFNVRARDASATQVTVSSGQVRVSSPRHPDRSVVLDAPGQSSRVTGDAPTPPEPANLDHALVWRKQGFAVTDQPLPVIVRELERRYGVTIELHPTLDRSRSTLSLYYPTRTDVETILRDVCTARGLSFRPTSRGFEIYDGDAPPVDSAST